MMIKRSSLLRWLVGTLLVVAMAGSVFAAPPNRIKQAIDDSAIAAVPGTAHPMAKKGTDQGLVDLGTRLEGLTIHFKPSATQQAALDQLLVEQRTPGSANYHKWLTQAEYASRFGMSDEDLAKVTAWLTQEGFAVQGISASRNTIRFSGTAALVENAFHTSLHKYLVNGETHFANASEVRLPAAFAASVAHVRGLNDFRPKSHLQRAPAALLEKEAAEHAASPRFTSYYSGNNFVAPGDFAVIYDVNALYNAGYTGTGQQIAVIGQTNIHTADITAFRSAAGLSTANLTTVCISASTYCTGTASYSSDDEVEADLDVEWSGAVAKNATVNYIFAGGTDSSNDAMSALEYAIEDYTVSSKVVPIISVSYGACEADWGSAEATALQTYIQQANAQGQTVIAASGDSGATDCDADTESSATYGLAVDVPASVPEVTAAGGAEFLADQTSASTYWSSATSADVLTSALSYIPEEAWNDTLTEGTLSSGGGGVSTLFAVPTWQANLSPTGFSGTAMRFVPDLSLNASPAHDGYLFCDQLYSSSGSAEGTSCTNGFRYGSGSGSLSVVGGTSAVAPAFAGILSLIEQRAGVSGYGNINPTLYAVAANSTAYASAFHDITSGTNEMPCTTGTTDCANGGDIGYAAGTGYDLATGLGSVDAYNLATEMIASEAATNTTTALTLSPSSGIVADETVTLTATVAASSGSTIPAGTVTFSIDGKALDVGAITLSAAGVASTTVTFSNSGNYTIAAAYSSSDLSFNSSSASKAITVSSPVTAATTTTTVTPSVSSVVKGVGFSLSATVTSTTSGTIAGNVTFSAGSTTLGTVTATSGTTATASLSVTAAQSAALSTGSVTITAAYLGSSDYAASSGTSSITVKAAPSVSVVIGDLTISSSKSGSSGSSTVTFTSNNSFAGTVDLTNTTWTVSPATLNAEAGVSSTSVTLTSGGTATDLLTVQLTSDASSARKGTGFVVRRAGNKISRNSHAARYGGGALLLLAGTFFFLPRRRKTMPLLLALLALAALAASTSCGGGSSSSSSSTSYTVTVSNIVATDTATGLQSTSTAQFTLTVQ